MRSTQVPGNVLPRGGITLLSIRPHGLFGLLLALVSGSAHAHSFQVGFLAPLSGPRAEFARQALDGFMLATTERDSHPDQHSDGHLGGLDVYVRRIDTAQRTDATRGVVRRLLHEEKVEILTGITTEEVAGVVRKELAGTTSVLFAVDESRLTGEDVTDSAFASAFYAEHGYSPLRAARVGYCLAHAIDTAVRKLADDFSDSVRLMELLDGTDC